MLLSYVGRSAPYIDGFTVSAGSIKAMYPSTNSGRKLTHTVVVFDGEDPEVVGNYDTLKAQWDAAIAAPVAGARPPVEFNTVDGHETLVFPDKVVKLKVYEDQGDPPITQVEITTQDGKSIAVTDSIAVVVAALS